MYQFVYENLPGVLVTIALLLISHVAMWDKRGVTWRLASYIVGCLCIASGMAVNALLTDTWLPFALYTLHLAGGGTCVLGAWRIRGWQAARRQAAADAAAIDEDARRAERTY